MFSILRPGYFISSGFALSVLLACTAKADVIENLTFSGNIQCRFVDSCRNPVSGSLIGYYSLDVTTQQILGAWSFSAPFQTLSSNAPGAASIVFSGLENNYGYSMHFSNASPTFFGFYEFYFPASNPQEIGAVGSLYSGSCLNIPGTGACYSEYVITGSTALAATPESPSLVLLGTGLLSLLGAGLDRCRQRD